MPTEKDVLNVPKRCLDRLIGEKNKDDSGDERV